ncbi:MAG: hypothetical protein A3D92_22725 [Bacteroidetes bacterium RIFCSPHIGHO2_02_FULL_44_7]|nr:MAG: hypothetical protein A3D92_22725 [Bacteroidetes bacterium RIFCSPHIGHO2_02_FULL_44_7]
MPAYNAEKYISVSIESVLNQTFDDFELLVISDFSTDGTNRIVEDFAAKDRRVKLLTNQHEKGLVGALNTGLENSVAKYIARADADDICRPYRFARQVEFLDKHPEVGLLGGGYAPFNDKGYRFDMYHPTSSLEIAWRQVANTFFAHPTVMFRREVYEKFGGYDNVEAEDFAYFSRAVKFFRGANLRVILIDYRESQTNRSCLCAEKIEVSAKKTFLENFQYYLGNTVDADIYYAYQNRHILKVKDLGRVWRINNRLISRIRKDYGIGALDRSVAVIYMKMWRDFLRKLLVSYVGRDPKYAYYFLQKKWRSMMPRHRSE